jgi:uncharacterized protein DUF4224
LLESFSTLHRERVSICLTRAELIELTGKKQRNAQLRVLVALGIDYKVRPDGEILVLRSLVEAALGGKRTRTVCVEPNWEALKK